MENKGVCRALYLTESLTHATMGSPKRRFEFRLTGMIFPSASINFLSDILLSTTRMFAPFCSKSSARRAITDDTPERRKKKEGHGRSAIQADKRTLSLSRHSTAVILFLHYQTNNNICVSIKKEIMKKCISF